MKPNRNMIAPCPFFPHDVGVSDCGSAYFFLFSYFFPFFPLPFSGLAQRTRIYLRVSRRVYLSLHAYTGTTVFNVIIIVIIVTVIVIVIVIVIVDTSMCDTFLFAVVTESKRACAILYVYGTVNG